MRCGAVDRIKEYAYIAGSLRIAPRQRGSEPLDTSATEASTLLGTEDPEPVEVLRPEGGAELFLTCEHAGRAIPRRLGALGLEERDLERHIAWDIGAAGVARRLSAKLDATLVLQRYSRLVVDCNRAPGAHDFVATLSEDTEIPGNFDVSEEERLEREVEIFRPYHDTVRNLLDERIAKRRPVVLVSVHSCTPVFLGVSRPWHIGVLYERDRRYAGIVLGLLGGDPELVVGDNEPYFMTDEKDYSVPVHGEQRGIPHVELELRQDLVAQESGQAEWADRLARVLVKGAGMLRNEGML